MEAPTNKLNQETINPLVGLDEWEDDVLRRYPEADSIVKDKSTEEFRNYDTPVRDTVREFYKMNHSYQTL